VAHGTQAEKPKEGSRGEHFKANMAARYGFDRVFTVVVTAAALVGIVVLVVLLVDVARDGFITDGAYGLLLRTDARAWVHPDLRGGGLDESPHVYRRLPAVLAAQGRTIDVLHTLRPLIVVMAGPDQFDPYKD